MTVGHQVMLHGCTIKEGSLIGIQAVVLNGAVIGRNCRIDPNSTPDAFEQLEIASGATVTRGQRRTV